MGLDSNSLGDSSVPAGDRVRAAGLKMDGYFDQLIKGKARLRPLPTLLREKMPYKVYDGGVARALELAQGMKPAADTTKPSGALRPAPGGPPIPGAAPTAPKPADSGTSKPK